MIRTHLELILTLSLLVGQYCAMPNKIKQYEGIIHNGTLVPSMDVIPYRFETATYVLEDPQDAVSEVLSIC